MLGEFVSRQSAAVLAARTRQQAQRLLDFDPDVVRACYNQTPFLLKHRLTEHLGFSLPTLFGLCRRLPREQVKYRVGAIPGDTNFDASFTRFSEGLTLDDVLERFEESKAYICVYNPERDPAYRPVLEGLLAEIAAGIEAIDPVITWYSTYIFISTRDSVTPYHMDREMNYLLQIRGEKTAYLWNPRDDEVMTPAEKDRLLADFDSRRPVYKASFEAKSMRYELRPGLGVHHPFIAPHRVHTGSDLSVSLAFTFRTQTSDVWSRAHAFNHVLRVCGLSPAPVGQGHLYADRAKAVASRAMRGPVRLLQRGWRASAIAGLSRP
ncbi:MAG: transcription factor jumonji JmjC domain-containing protein [Variovorax sp.]|nr:MAG: transcription factor jumonji JmjC domain-containing protein [Variovorax sp.]